MKWVDVGLYVHVDVMVYPATNIGYITSLILEVGFQVDSTATVVATDAYDTDKMADEVRRTYNNIPHTENQQYYFRYENKSPYLSLRVKNMDARTLSGTTSGITSTGKRDVGILTPNSKIEFDRSVHLLIQNQTNLYQVLNAFILKLLKCFCACPTYRCTHRCALLEKCSIKLLFFANQS